MRRQPVYMLQPQKDCQEKVDSSFKNYLYDVAGFSLDLSITGLTNAVDSKF